ncbi:sulfotransferase [Sphingomonas sp. RHCKR7]|nr:sulfotransferase [Sphingomonas folli]
MAPSLGRETRLTRARALRSRGRADAALAAVSRLLARDPGFGRGHEERAHCLALLGDTAAARAALRVAVRLNPTLPASWRLLEQLCTAAGDREGARRAAGQAAILAQLPAALVVANSCHAEGDGAAAERALRTYLRDDPENVGALRLLARVRGEAGALDEAAGLLGRVLVLAADYDDARLDLGLVQLRRRDGAAARGVADALLARAPHRRGALKLYAAACVLLGDEAAAIPVYDELLRATSAPRDEVAELHVWRANALKAVGRGAEAVAGYRAALTVRPEHGVAWFSLANLKTYAFTAADVAAMTAAEAAHDADPRDRIYRAFALGKALEDRGDHAASWQHYARGNALRHRTSHYSAEVVEQRVAHMRASFTPEVFAARAGWGVADAAPIFVTGLPRSGSTLIEQMLASHPDVEGTYELPELPALAREVCGGDHACALPVDPSALLRLSAAEVRSLGERYLAATVRHRRAGRVRFIDKTPDNIWHVAFIQLILPDATIVDVRRAPMASCFATFKQLFGDGHHEFSYTLEDSARHYRAYAAMTRHWDAVLPGRVIRVLHEELVAAPEPQVRRLLAHAGLTFDPGCLAYHTNARSVRTPSAEQVRQPLQRDAPTRWRPYERWLAPVRAVLGDEGASDDAA